MPLDIRDEDSISEVLLALDMALQYGEDAEVRTRELDDGDEEQQCGGEE